MRTFGARAALVLTIGASALPAAAAPAPEAVLDLYADIALAGYGDALTTARALDVAIDAFLDDPSEDTLALARDAWRAARPWYQQTEVFRFGNPIVDAWEGRVNAWPLDEGLIDYVAPAYGSESDENVLYAANVIANPRLVGDGYDIDATAITPAVLREELQEAGGIEANVATGYHAIEFLLWGQDLGEGAMEAGSRPASDFDLANCTNGNCDRRAQYLKAASELLVSDLEEMVANWQDGGPARADLATTGLSAILTGMGSLSFGELAGERMKLGLLLHDSEEEHDCFSDNTQVSHLNDAIGIRNVYLGRYGRLDGGVVQGPSISELVAAKDGALDTEIRALLDETVSRMQAIVQRAETVEHYDRMIAEGNADGNAVVQAAIDALIAQTRGIERAVAALGLSGVTIQQSDSLTSPDAVFQ